MNTAQATGASQTSAVMIRKTCRTIREMLSGRLRTGRVSSATAAGAGAVGGGRDARHACSVSWKLFQTKTMIGTIEITIRITAIAEP